MKKKKTVCLCPEVYHSSQCLYSKEEEEGQLTLGGKVNGLFFTTSCSHGWLSVLWMPKEYKRRERMARRRGDTNKGDGDRGFLFFFLVKGGDPMEGVVARKVQECGSKGQSEGERFPLFCVPA